MVTRKIARGAWMNPAETGLYYLQSRYYDPETGRFISIDAYMATGRGILGYNMYVYCNNNPMNYSDSTGRLPQNINLNNMMLHGGGGMPAMGVGVYIAESNAPDIYSQGGFAIATPVELHGEIGNSWVYVYNSGR